MYLMDYHLHSKYSFDGQADIEKICDQAILSGMQEIALTDHLDIYTDQPYDFQLDCETLYKDVQNAQEQYKGRLKVRFGVEFGQPQMNPGQANRYLQAWGDKLDFIIGSIHNIDKDFDIYYFDFKNGDCKALYQNYLEWLLVLARDWEFDVMGHITYPLRYMHQFAGAELDLKPYTDQFTALFKLLVARGKGIEVNTSGYLKAMNDAMPNLEVLKLYRACGGEIVTVGSDSHQAKTVGLTIKKGCDLLQAAGFKYVTAFEQRRPKFYEL